MAATEPSPSEFQPYRKVQGAAEAELRSILDSTAKAIARRIAGLKPGIGGQIRAAQLNTTLAAIKKLQRAMWVGRIGPLVEQGVIDAEKAAESAIEAMTRVAYASLNEPAAEALVRGLRLSAESGLKSDAARKKRELSDRVYHQAALHNGQVEKTIRQGLVANLTAKELAETVRGYISPNVKGGESYAAMRLARTEINNAFHERQLQGATRPGVRAVKWNLSGSHVVPDKCNEYAAHEGKGLWPPDKVPDKPHPFCFCYLTYVTQSSEEFRAALANGDYDAEIDRRTRENMARLGRPVSAKPLSVVPKASQLAPKTGDAAHDVVPKGLYKRGSLTPKQRDELKTYETGWFMVINNFLRGKHWGDPEYKRDEQTVNVLMGAMKESVLPEPIQTWRGMFNAKLVFGESYDHNLEGFTWDDLGFGSTTTDESIVNQFILPSESHRKDLDANVKMKVNIPAGVQALQISTATKGSKVNGPQAEITLQSGLTWRVVKDNGFDSKGTRQLEVEVYPIGQRAK